MLCLHVAFACASGVNVYVKFNIVLMVMQMHMQRMASDPFSVSAIDSIQNLTQTFTLTQTQTLSVNRT